MPLPNENLEARTSANVGSYIKIKHDGGGEEQPIPR